MAQVMISHSFEETQQIAAHLAEHIKNTGGVITLQGELGAGKTAFVQGFAKALGIAQKIISPTFVLVRQYQIPHTTHIMYHIDLYRLHTVTPTELGFSDMVDNPHNIVLMEWPGRLSTPLPYPHINITIDVVSDSERRISITQKD